MPSRRRIWRGLRAQPWRRRALREPRRSNRRARHLPGSHPGPDRGFGVGPRLETAAVPPRTRDTKPGRSSSGELGQKRPYPGGSRCPSYVLADTLDEGVERRPAEVSQSVGVLIQQPSLLNGMHNRVAEAPTEAHPLGVPEVAAPAARLGAAPLVGLVLLPKVEELRTRDELRIQGAPRGDDPAGLEAPRYLFEAIGLARDLLPKGRELIGGD